MVYKFFDKKTKSIGVTTTLANKSAIKSIPQKEQLTSEVYSTFKDNIWGADFADMQLISKYNKEIKYLLCAIDLYSKYAWIHPLNDKKVLSIVKSFQKVLDDSNRKPNNIWVDKGGEFYNNFC